MKLQKLLYEWKTELNQMRKWYRFNSGVDAVKAVGEYNRLSKDIEQLEEAIGNPKGNEWTDYVLKKNLELRGINVKVC